MTLEEAVIGVNSESEGGWHVTTKVARQVNANALTLSGLARVSISLIKKMMLRWMMTAWVWKHGLLNEYFIMEL